MKFRAIFV